LDCINTGHPSDASHNVRRASAELLIKHNPQLGRGNLLFGDVK
jgi:hypothetical protein